jgi:hypothetical protein
MKTFRGPRRTPQHRNHTDWCARDHRCTGSLHQSPPITADVVGGWANLTRVRSGDVEYALIQARIRLNGPDRIARRRIGLALHLLRRLFAAVAAVRPEPLPAANSRPALDRRPAA